MIDVMSKRFVSLNEMTTSECLARLATVEHGRLAISHKALPVVVPVKVSFLENRLHVSSLLGNAIPLSAGSVVALEVGTMGSNTPDEWSVEVRGLLQPSAVPQASEAGL